jgi:excisionase family DNA binding protein
MALTHTHPERLLSVRAAAERLGLSEVTLYKWIRGRRLSSVRLGRRVLVSAEALGDYCRTHTVPAHEDSAAPAAEASE